MKLKNTVFMSGVITTVRLSTGFLSNKVLAVFIGPAGIALLAQFQSFVNIVTVIATGAVDKGVVKYSSELKENDVERYKMLSTAFILCLVVSIICGIVIVCSSHYLAALLQINLKYIFVFYALAGVLIAYSLNQLLMSLINGVGDINLYTWANLIGSVIGLIFTYFLSVKYGVSGALIAIVAAQSLNFIITLFLAIKYRVINLRKLNFQLNHEYLHKLNKFSLISITIVLCTSLTQIITRDYLMQQVSIDFAGYWLGIQRISDAYLMIITTALTTYYLPTIARLKNFEDIKDELYRGYSFIIPLIIASATLIYIFRHAIILILYSKKFLPMADLFIWQFIGDIFKICGSMIAQVIMARSMVKLYILSEVLYNAFYILSAIIFIHLFGGMGSVISFTVTYFFYFIILYFLLMRRYVC